MPEIDALQNLSNAEIVLTRVNRYPAPDSWRGRLWQEIVLGTRENVNVFPTRKGITNLNYDKVLASPETVRIIEIVTRKLTVTFKDENGAIKVGSVHRGGVRIALGNGKQYMVFFENE
ncbi:MAG: hypothetical protein PHS44_01130 [Candidatus Dojkabacteria bacterium]|nr:hypothetical protein [Candidatus Dojkabacteria bacterium]